MKPTQEHLIRTRQDELITQAYCTMTGAVRGYISRRIGYTHEAEDLTQECFARLLEYQTLLTEQTLRNLIYTIARNLVIDYLRHHAHTVRAREYFSQRATSAISHNTEEEVESNDLERIEQSLLEGLSERRAEIYRRSIHQGQTAEEIAMQLDLSRRTVENHLFKARQQMREALRYAL